MKLELFSVPIFIGNVDLKRIKLDAEMGEAFLSKTPSSFYKKNILDPESGKYLISIIAELLKEKYQYFTVNLNGVWRNKYLNNDFQEPHIQYLISATLGPSDAYVLQQFKPQVTKGQIIVFPSYVEHMVNKNSDQVTISGNLDFKFINKLTKEKE